MGIKANRLTAGAAYTAAVAALRSALVELAAYDLAAKNINVIKSGDGDFDAHAFADLPQSIPRQLQHQDFAPGPGANIHEEVRARANQIIAAGS